MAIKSGGSVLNGFPMKSVENNGGGGGNSGCVISASPGLGLSAYQDPKAPVLLPSKREGGT
jgi:hypothetical protein